MSLKEKKDIIRIIELINQQLKTFQADGDHLSTKDIVSRGKAASIAA